MEKKKIETPGNAEHYTAQIYDRPDMEYPVYSVNTPKGVVFIQRMEGMNPSDTAWYQVQQEKGFWNRINSQDIFGGHLGCSKKEAIDEIRKKNENTKSKTMDLW